MQQIERYGVIALVFLLVTIVAVSFWGDSKSPGFWSRLTGKSDAKKEQADKAAAAEALARQHVTDPALQLSPAGGAIPPVAPPELANGNVGTPVDQPPAPADPNLVAANPAPNTMPVESNPFGPNPNVVPLAPNPVPQAPIATQYVVQKGDSLASIARKKLGDEQRWTEIQALNPGLQAKNLRVGKPIQLPAAGLLTTSTPPVAIAKAPARTSLKAIAKVDPPKATKRTPSTSGIYIVKKGDGLRSIARKELGDESRWRDILAANPGINANKIHPGDALKMPVSARQPSTSKPDKAPVLAAVSAPTHTDKPRVR